MNFTVDLGILFQLGTLAVFAGGAYARLKMLERRVEEVKKECSRQVNDLRVEHSDYHDIKAAVLVIQSKLDTLTETMRQMYAHSFSAARVNNGGDN